MERYACIREICEWEWLMFDQVENAGGRASCQNDPEFFKKMRASQFVAWDDDALESYREDLIKAHEEGRNLLSEKYAWMMESTHPAEFAELKHELPELSSEALGIIAEIKALQLDWEREVDKMWPAVRSGGRPLTKDLDSAYVTSFETYLDGELKTYSLKTLKAYLADLKRIKEAGENPALLVAEATVRFYGYDGLEDAERRALSRR